MSMTIKTAANRVLQEYKQDFLKSADEAPHLWPDYATEVPSRSRSTLHAWLANQATVREWVGPRVAKNMSSMTWEVTNRKWELTFEFDRDQVEDDLEGLVASAVMAARDQGEKFARHADLLVAQTLEAGVSSLCYDGQFFFDTDHPVDPDGVTSGTFDNDRALSLTHANYNTVYTAMLGFQNYDGSPAVLPQGLILMVPPALNLTAKQIVEVDTLTPAAAYGLVNTTGASRNPIVGSARVVVNQYLTSTTRWYLLAGGGVIKPIMLQQRRPLEIDEQREGSDLYFEEEKFRIGGSARYAASYTIPTLAITSAP